MSTYVGVNTYTHGVTYVTGQLLGSLKRIITWSGLDIGKLMGDWKTLEEGISFWMGSKHLSGVKLEIYNRANNDFVGRWDFEINYTYCSSDDGAMWVDTDAIKHAIAKANAVPANCTYDIIVSRAPGFIAGPLSFLVGLFGPSRDELINWGTSEGEATLVALIGILENVIPPLARSPSMMVRLNLAKMLSSLKKWRELPPNMLHILKILETDNRARVRKAALG